MTASTPWLAKQVGLNRAVSLTLLSRIWSVLVGFVTIFFIGRFLTPAAQGYYFTFSSLIALQVFVELGLTYAIVQFASHEMSQLEWLRDGTVDGPAGAKKRLQSLLKFSFAWFGGAAFLMAAILVPLGAFVVGFDSSPGMPIKNVLVPWVCLVVLSSANLVVTAVVSLLEGCGQIVGVALLRLAQAVVSGIAIWCVLALGGVLFALVVQAAATLFIGVAWLALAYRPFLKDLLSFRSRMPGMDWRHEIWPFHWRLAISWTCGYLIFQLFNPLLFATHGPVAAGQMGLSLQIIGALNGVAMSWISTKAPLYGQMVARREGRALDQLFLRSLVQSSAVLLLCLIGAMTTLYAMHEMGSLLVKRLLPMSLMAWLAVIAMANHIVFAEAALLRAHKQDPFMLLSVINGLATALIAVFLIPAKGLEGAVASYAVGAIVIGLIGGTVIFFRKRRNWWLNDALP